MTLSSHGVPARAVPADRVAYRLAGDVRVVDHEGDVLLVGDAVLWRLPASFIPAARRLSAWQCERDLFADLPPDRLVTALASLRRLVGLGHVDQELRDGSGRPILRVRQVGGTLVQDLRASTQQLEISRFTVMRAEGQELVVEHPGKHAVLTFPDDRAGTLLMRLVAGGGPEQRRGLGLEDDEVGFVTAILLEAGIGQPAVAPDLVRESEDPRLRPWKWHDVAAHFRSRRGRHRYPTHSTYHLRDAQPPEPGLKESMSDRIIDLPIVDIDALRTSDMTLTDAIEDRFAGRDHAEQPMDLGQLSELLFRSARVRWFSPATEESFYDQTSRPYPTGGATYDLEIYVTVDRCTGLDRGIYHYDPDRHALAFLAELGPATDRMLADATGATGGLMRPQVLLTVASRFARISWKYEGMAYATTLRNVGVLYQTVWLVATAMGLACCPLGGGDTTAFAQATGLDPFEESNVGEIALGSLAANARRGNRAANARQGSWADRA